MKKFLKDRSAALAFWVVVFFVVTSFLAPFLASPLPFVVWQNQSGQELPFSPRLAALQAQKQALLERHPYRLWAAEGKIRAIFAPVPFSPFEGQMEEKLSPPAWGRFAHYLGTDSLGRDVAARMIHGARNSMMVGLVAVGISIAVGIFLGALAGYFGGWLDLLVSRFIEIVICFPSLILIMAVLAILKPSLLNIMVIIGLTGWTGTARVIRAEFLKRKNLDFVLAARVSGASHFRLIFYHILPESMPPVLVMASFGVAGAVFIESSLSFLGIGVQPPEPSWGQILNTSRPYMDFAWWLTTFPGVAIFMTVVAYNLLGERLRKNLNPREN